MSVPRFNLRMPLRQQPKKRVLIEFDRNIVPVTDKLRCYAGVHLASENVQIPRIIALIQLHWIMRRLIRNVLEEDFKLLTTLARYPGRVYTRMELVEKVLGYDFEGYERTIDSHVKNLRAKLGDDPRNPRWLYTVHGVGYRFEAPEKAADQAAR